VQWKVFWRLFFQKLLRNFASMKYQWLTLLYIPIIYGMFSGRWVDGQWIGKIESVEGLSYLGGAFVTVMGIRIYAKTKLNETDEEFYEGENEINEVN